MTREMLDAYYIYYMATNNYTYHEYDLDANWRYWCKEPVNGGFSWIRYLLKNVNGNWKYATP